MRRSAEIVVMSLIVANLVPIIFHAVALSREVLGCRVQLIESLCERNALGAATVDIDKHHDRKWEAN